MRIEFYEEFPTKENLQKLKLIKFPTKLFIAAKSLKEFQEYESIAKSFKKDVECAYWPIVRNSYYISTFSNPKDLKGLFEELNNIDNPLLLDLELPVKNISLFFKNFFNFRRNKKEIANFLEKNKKRITTAEYPWIFISKLMKIIGLNFNVNYERSIMWYSSMFPNFLNKGVISSLPKIKNKKNYSVSLGTIAVGVLGNEPILSAEKLKEDINIVKSSGFEKIVIFRLGGINKKYLEVLERFIKS